MTVEPFCRHHPRGHSDAAKRVSDATILAWVATGWDGYVGHWMLFSLQAGISDNVLYPSKRDAIRHVSNEFHYMYVKMHPNGMEPCEAEIMLKFTRDAHAAGFRLADPDAKTGGPDLIPRIGYENILSQIRALRKAGGIRG